MSAGLELLRSDYVEQIRRQPHRPDHVTGYSGVHDGPGVAKRRAFCRGCGGPIRTGEQVIRFTYDWIGGGSWTSTTGMLHETCEPSDGGTHGACADREAGR